ncbi:GDP-mannose pyrophosphatase [Asaia sp. W19]|uniref:NUDIX domain-containing protein n=1 Tax=unclassified Asaia TaxID=2685023 RepID=UPI000F8DB371|nr:NUDIX domain-containing protein [Asaia sp. W19]RUT24710.1 GDP-mannose pyrophosphatase [Asaia sp. W19]
MTDEKSPSSPGEPERVTIGQTRLLANDWGVLTKYTLTYHRRDGVAQQLTRETYDRGDGAAILLINAATHTVLLTRQFRLPAYVSGHREDLIEVCGGMLDDHDPAAAIRREVEEEMGVTIDAVRKIGCYYMSPGSVTERIHFFIGAYDSSMRRAAGGGLQEEGEEIEVLELDFDEALAMIDDGHIVDAKTIMLLQHAALKNLFDRA